MEILTIGKLAKRGKINIETIRYYERIGLIPKPPRTSSGYRIFTADTVNRVLFIKRAKELGFSLKEIKDLLALRIAPESTTADVRIRAKAKIGDIEEKIVTLRSMKKALQRLTLACKGQGSVSDCPILESLSDEEEANKEKQKREVIL